MSYFFLTHITSFWYFYPLCLKKTNKQTEAQRKFSTVSIWLIMGKAQAVTGQVWPSLRPTVFPFHNDGSWEQRRFIYPSQFRHVMPALLLFLKVNYEWSYPLEYCTIENKIFPPKISRCPESWISQPGLHPTYVSYFEIQDSVYLDHLLKDWTRFTHLSFRSGAGNSPKDKFPGKGNESHMQLDFNAG